MKDYPTSHEKVTDKSVAFSLKYGILRMPYFFLCSVDNSLNKASFMAK